MTCFTFLIMSLIPIKIEDLLGWFTVEEKVNETIHQGKILSSCKWYRMPAFRMAPNVRALPNPADYTSHSD